MSLNKLNYNENHNMKPSYPLDNMQSNEDKMHNQTSFGLPIIVIQQIQAVFALHPEVEKVVIYGSRAKQTYKNGSDIDLSLFGDKISSSIESAIRSDLDDLLIPYMIDLSIFSQINNEKLKEHIMRVGHIFYKK